MSLSEVQAIEARMRELRVPEPCIEKHVSRLKKLVRVPVKEPSKKVRQSKDPERLLLRVRQLRTAGFSDNQIRMKLHLTRTQVALFSSMRCDRPLQEGIGWVNHTSRKIGAG